MKRLLILFLVLFPGLALAQTGPEVYKVATPAQIQGISTSSQSITNAIFFRMIRAVCTEDCYIWVNSSGQNFPATTETGVFLPADNPVILSVSPGSKVAVVGTTGSLHIIELTK